MIAWLALSACKPVDSAAVGDSAVESAPTESAPSETGPRPVDTGGATDSEPDAAPSSTPHLPLPFVEVGGGAPAGSLEVRAGSAATGPLEVSVDGPFVVDGSLAPLAAGDARSLTVTWSGDTATPQNVVGSVVVTVDGRALVTTVAAVIGAAGLGAGAWERDAWGQRLTVTLPSSPYPWGGAPYSDASVLIAVPPGVAPRDGIGAVTHLHGHNAVLAETVAGKHLVEQHALSGRDALLIVPQGPYDAADSDFGRLEEPGAHAALVRDAFAVAYRDGVVLWPVPGQQAVTAHSGGYHGTAAIVEAGGLPVDAVHLFDALYAEQATFEAYAVGGGVLRSVYTASGGTTSENVALRDDLRASGLTVGTTFDDASLVGARVTVGASGGTHDGCVTEERAFARWLAASGLRRGPWAPPELLSVASDGVTARVVWRADADGRSHVWQVEGSTDGASWEVLAETSASEAEIPARAWVRVREADPVVGPGAPSDVYPGGGSRWLVVDGFDRVLDGSWAAGTHDFAARYGVALGGASSASNEAVAEGWVALSDYDGVLWFLGDESTGDVAFAAAEQAALSEFVSGGGRVIATGAEIGYAGGSFVTDTLGARYVSDDAGTDRVEGYTFGVVYEEDWPDVLAGDSVVWSYATGGAAAVGRDGRIVVVGFALETMDADFEAAVAELVGWVED